MTTQKISAKDIANKWSRSVAANRKDDQLVWSTLGKMVDGLTDTRLPVDVLNECIRTRDVGKLMTIADSLEPRQYASPAVLLQDRLVAEVFKKYSFSNSPFNKREKALLRFHEAEQMCRETNARLKFQPPTGAVNWVVDNAIVSIRNMLGTFHPDEMLRNSRFGPGSTLCVSGKMTTEYFKFRNTSPSVSQRAFPYAEALLNYDKKWLAYLTGIHPLDVAGRFNLVSHEVAPELRIEDQNKVTFVPKNAKTERSIAIEPYFNLYFQLGVGAMLRRRIRSNFGIDLSSQKRNQDLARVGSVSNELATIDFSMASDTIAKSVVELLLPPMWFDHMNRLRSHEYRLVGQEKPVIYQKFSSMGNGFTFELETLIFAAIARGVHQYLGLPIDEISVYGDDVILSSSAADLFETVTSYLGFRINDEKSYKEGPFRESCGEDFLRGTRVRPVFCEELDTTKDIVSFSNRLSALNRATTYDGWNPDWLNGVVSYLRGFIPRDIRRLLVGPPSDSMDTHIHEDDLGLIAQSDLVKWDHGLQRWNHPIVLFRAKVFKRSSPALVLCIHQRIRTPFVDEVPQLFRRSPYRTRRTALPRIQEESAVVDISEHTRFEITGREIGEFKLGTAAVYGLTAVPSIPA